VEEIAEIHHHRFRMQGNQATATAVDNRLSSATANYRQYDTINVQYQI
jgi:hypothetical protein